MNAEYRYDWFAPIRPTMERFVPAVAKWVLEIGSFEGMSARFFCEWCPKAIVTCVDHFKGSADQQDLDIGNLRDRFLLNTSDLSGRLHVIELDSWEAWRGLHSDFYEVIFVDGSHVAGDVLNDLTQAYRCCKVGGLILADDYSWENQRTDCPRTAIEAFMRCFQKRVKTLHIDRVAVMEKLC